MKRINTIEYKKVIKEVLIDDRETKRVDFALKNYAPFNPSVKHLLIGDYIFKNDNGDMVVFEYKSGNDFITSIANNHLHNQYYNMVTNYDYTFIIVECENLKDTIQDRYYSTGLDMSLSQLNGAIAEFCVNSTVLFAQTEYQAFDLMMRVAGKIFKNKPLRYKYGKKSKNSALNYLSSIRGVGNKADEIVNVLDLHTLEDLIGLDVEKLCKVNGIGRKKAVNILNQILKEYS